MHGGIDSKARRAAAAALGLVAFTLGLDTPAAAHGAPTVRLDIGLVTDVADGLMEVRLADGHTVTTHGVDADETPGTLPDLRRRPPVCASSNHQQLVYARPAGAPDRLQELRPRIEGTLMTANAMLDHSAIDSGGRHADYRVACDAAGHISIRSVTNPGTSAFADVISAVRAAMPAAGEVDYTIFYDDPAAKACGIGSLRNDDRPDASNANNRGGGYALLYPGCWDAATLMHEVGHNQGAVQAGAPNATGAGHCRDDADVMCYADGAEGAAGMLQRCAGADHWDCGYDDYFDVAPEPGEYLATHWNTGSPNNGFIHFSDVTEVLPTREDLTAEDPEAGEEPGARILGGARVRGRDAVRVKLACPGTRRGACEGIVRVSRGRVRSSWYSFRVRSGATAAVAVPFRGLRRSRGRLRVVVQDDQGGAPYARSVAVR